MRAYLLAALLAAVTHAQIARDPTTPRPAHDDHARLARWLVHSADWGVLSTLSTHLQGVPYGNAVSLSDGPAGGGGTGRLLFYLTAMDATAQDAAVNSSATLTLCEAQLPGGCSGVDPEDPTCAKLAISGRLSAVPLLPAEALRHAEELLFSRHPAMQSWPPDHGFRVYELQPAAIRLLDWYGGPRDLTPDEYWHGAAARRESGGDGRLGLAR
jgi:hypothetical protein